MVKNMLKILDFVETAYIEAQNLLPLLTDYTNPRDFLARAVKNGDLIRLKNGFFVLADKIKKEGVPYFQIANLLYGPSVLSFEWALSYYGLIPEGVYLITSASATKSKSFKTVLGTFEYIFLSHSRFAVGISQKENSAGKFLIATPEKALIDTLHLKAKNIRTPKELLDDLIEGRRIDEQDLRNLDKVHLLEIVKRYKSKTADMILKTLELL